MRAIYKMSIDCGRAGSLEGIFVAEDDEVNHLIDSKIEISFGEVLGKHSDIVATLERSEVERITDDPSVIEIFEKYGFHSGYDPFDYV